VWGQDPKNGLGCRRAAHLRVSDPFLERKKEKTLLTVLKLKNEQNITLIEFTAANLCVSAVPVVTFEVNLLRAPKIMQNEG
jgi:hypothetical protein